MLSFIFTKQDSAHIRSNPFSKSESSETVKLSSSNLIFWQSLIINQFVIEIQTELSLKHQITYLDQTYHIWIWRQICDHMFHTCSESGESSDAHEVCLWNAASSDILDTCNQLVRE